MNDKLTYGLLGLIIGGILVWIGFATVQNLNPGGMMHMRGSQSGKVVVNSDALDAPFIEQMIPHHESAIKMAKLAQTKAKRPEVMQLANTIIASQSKEITQMKSWYKSWYGKDVSESDGGMQNHAMGNETNMGTMNSANDEDQLANAEDFDKEFVREMIPHHQMAVMMANMLENGTDRPEMKKLATDIISAQSKEIEEMQTWLIEWK